ncbi:uncharacterized protein LOC115876910 [Sitophilus oryzae]|uniref:Uncharacterized protein LOC115876910 n=1 Tax=Sitophilus oryzae TaxID=7048 RepID=A0A6J2XBX0_SITOR|nr:uncharacterized protein LOC115876910 [Sitophilus oryzae]
MKGFILVVCVYWVHQVGAQHPIQEFYTSLPQTYIPQSYSFPTTFPNVIPYNFYQPPLLAYDIPQQISSLQNIVKLNGNEADHSNLSDSVPHFTRNEVNLNLVEKTFQLPKSLSIPTDTYRGYGYHTKFDDGASSAVVFFSGPPLLQESPQNSKEYITVASDSISSEVPQIEQRLNGILNDPTENNHKKQGDIYSSLAPLIKSLIENPQPLSNVFRFYAEPRITDTKQSRSLNLETTTTKNNTIMIKAGTTESTTIQSNIELENSTTVASSLSTSTSDSVQTTTFGNTTVKK